jgi:hypothetical protein
LKTLKKRIRAATWGVVACGLIVGDGNAWAQGPGPAQPAPAPSASAQAAPTAQQAEKRYEAGIKYVQADKWAEALEEFRQAYEASAQLKYLAALIKAEIATGQNVKATTHLVAMLRRRDELDPNTLAQAEEKLAELLKKVGAARIQVNVDGAEVLVDGKVVGTSPIADEVFMEPGRRTFQARKAGVGTAEESVDVAAGSKSAVTLGLKKAEAPGPGPVGAGKEGGGGPNKAVVYAGVAVASALAVVGVGTAIGAAVAEQKRDGDWDQANCTKASTFECYSNFDEQENKRVLLGNTAVWTFIGATAVGAGTLVYALTAKKPEKTPDKQAVCVELTVSGFRVRGTF